MRERLQWRETAWVAAAAAWLAYLLILPPRTSSWVVVISALPLLLSGSWLAALRTRIPWRAFIRATLDLHALALVLVAGLGVQCADAHGITTDGVTYFAQLRSLLIDHDLDVTREYGYLGQPTRPGYFVPLGPTVLWLPLYLAVLVVDTIGRGLHLWSAPSDPAALGLTLPYVRAVLISSYVVGAAGLIAVQRYLRVRFPIGVAFFATWLLFGATPLYWYMVYEPAMTHAASFGVVALFVVACAAWVPTRLTPARRAWLGTLAAIAFLIRPQEALFVLWPAVLVLTAPTPWRARVRSGFGLLGPAALAAAPWLVLQAVHGYALYRASGFAFFGAQGYLNPWHGRTLDTLFSSWHGLFSWTPIVYVAAVGTLFYIVRDRRWALTALALLTMMAWVNGSTADWAAGWSFGGRRFSSTLPMLAPGLALTIDGLRRRPMLAIAPLAIVALWWNYLLMVQYTAGMLPKDAPVSFGRLVRQQAEVYTRPPYFYPFAFPANLIFAWRTGLPAERYDVLVGDAPQPAIDLAFDARVERFLRTGWEAPSGDDWGPCWWIGDSPAALSIPLELDPARDVIVEVRARTRFEEPTREARLEVMVNGRAIGTLTASAREPSVVRFTLPAERARAIWHRGYNDIAFRSLGADPVDPSDTREPGPLARRLERRPWPVAIYTLRVQPQ